MELENVVKSGFHQYWLESFVLNELYQDKTNIN